MKFVFVSCQNANQGAQNAYRRMIFEDKQAAEADRIGFILHLGDFIYEIVWYPEDRPQGMYDRKIFDVVRYPDGEKHEDFHIPTTVDGYRAIYRGYLNDPDLQDARARWPFVNMWDNHEFSWLGWQSLTNLRGQDASGANAKSGGDAGVLRISTGTDVAAEFAFAGKVRSAACRRYAGDIVRRARTWDGAQQSNGARQSERLSRDSLRQKYGTDRHGSAHVSLGRPNGNGGSRTRFRAGIFRR